MKVLPSREGYFPLLFLPLPAPLEPLDLGVFRKREVLALAKLRTSAGVTNEEEEATLSFLGTLLSQEEAAGLLLLLFLRLDFPSYWKSESALETLGVA